MSTHRIEDLTPPRFVGGPVERATAVVEHFADRIPEKTEDGADAILADPDARRWIQDCIDAAAAELPEELTYLEATAKALGRTLESVFAGHHRAFFPPEESPKFESVPPDDDGCSVSAARHAERGAWVVKNRDNNVEVLRRHVITHHVDPAWGGREIVATATVGGPVAPSGGINTSGFCVVSTSIGVHRPAPGIHRTMLMGALLARCDTVDEALAIVGRVRHLGGTITMADASGGVATVELDPDSVHIERPGNRPWVAHTNHVCGRPPLATEKPDSPKYQNSQQRLAVVRSSMEPYADEGGAWSDTEAWIMERMTSHEGPAPVCRHNLAESTIATSIFASNPPMLLTSFGPGCEGHWGRWTPSS